MWLSVRYVLSVVLILWRSSAICSAVVVAELCSMILRYVLSFGLVLDGCIIIWLPG